MAKNTFSVLPGHQNLLKIISWNCKGVNAAIKRGNILTHLKKLDMDIGFLQETHLKDQDHKRLQTKWIGQVFHSNFPVKNRGAAIIIKKTIPFIATKVISDSRGRYVIVTGKIFHHPITLASVYAPNTDDENFINSFFAALPNMNSHQLIIGGDFNLVLDPIIDRSSQKTFNISKSAKTIQRFMNTYKLLDPFRVLNPSLKKYSYFSPVHHSFSRIDFFLIDYANITNIKHCDYEAIVLSDHSPVSFHLAMGYNITIKKWRFNNSLVSDDKIIEGLHNQIQIFLQTNDSPEISRSTLWETFKAYLRGQIISLSSLKNKRRREKESKITQELVEADRVYACSPTPDLYKKRQSLQTELNLLYTAETTQLLRQSRHKYYEYGEKTGKLLAQQIKETTASRLITEIRTDSGQTTNPKIINDTFKHFYSKLYSSESKNDQKLIDNFFENLQIPTISLDNRKSLDQPITKEEIKKAVGSMQNSKCPGPDGYSIEFYKVFIEQIAPLLLNVYNEALTTGLLPPTLYEASISLIHKTGKDPLEPGSYRPISLLNVDYKILAKILAMRLESVLPTVVSPDQTGFVKERLLFFNIRRLFNIIYTQNANKHESEVLLSLDAEKAFDRVEWDFLFSTLSRFGFGPQYISLIKLLYAQPKASVRTNNMDSSFFSLHRSTRQGCPLSPLLFALTMEPLAILLRSSKDYKGIVRGGIEHKVSLYADDLLLYISSPSLSLQKIMVMLSDFGTVSGYKINLAKSILFPISFIAKKQRNVLAPFPFAISDTFKYLGINVTQEISGLFKENFVKRYQQTVQQLEKWTKLPISLAGRINIIKMNVLPKYLFLFQCVPILLNKKFFTKIDSLISSFIWNKKAPRIKKSFLQRPKSMGGMGLPSFRLYYWACNIRCMSFWNSTVKSDWEQMENNAFTPNSLKSLLYHTSDISRFKCQNPVVSHSLKIWSQIRKHFHWNHCSILTPLTNNQAHKLFSGKTFQQWVFKGAGSIIDLFIDKSFPTFEQLKQKFKIDNKDFFKYLQVRDFIKTTFPSFPNQPQEYLMNNILLKDPLKKGSVSKVYNNLAEIDCTTSLDHIKDAWNEDFGLDITREQWSEAQERVHSSSVCIRHGLLQFKILHRLHLSKQRLSRMFPGVDASCERCGYAPASLSHTFWNCPNITLYWSKIIKTLSEIFKITLPIDPIMSLLGVVPADINLNSAQVNVLCFVMLLARRLILLNWKNKIPPTHQNLMREIMQHLQLEKIKFSLRQKEHMFSSIWQPFIDYYNKI